MANFEEHERKQVIRKLWCKPQLKLLHDKLRRKLIYIGLPDINAYDVIEWLEYIEKVIAFQCSRYGTEVIDVAKLEKLLNDLEVKGKLKSSVVYVGWMEKIIFGGVSEKGQLYKQSEFLKVYNLDFCNNLGSPYDVVNQNGIITRKIYKIDVIDKFLEYQAKQASGEKFIMYLTINSNFFADNLATINKQYLKDYTKVLAKITKPEVVAIRKIKAFAFEKITERFHNNGFHVEFLPPIYYQGSLYPNREKSGKKENHRMMTFTILGTKNTTDNPSYKQNPDLFLKQRLIFANNKSISCYDDKYIRETDYDPDVVKLVKASYTYTKLWT
jgi:hypothetical protein